MGFLVVGLLVAIGCLSVARSADPRELASRGCSLIAQEVDARAGLRFDHLDAIRVIYLVCRTDEKTSERMEETSGSCVILLSVVLLSTTKWVRLVHLDCSLIEILA